MGSQTGLDQLTTNPEANPVKLFTVVIYEFSLYARVLVPVPANIRLGWKGLKGTNTGLLPKFVNCDRKKFCRIGPKGLLYKHITVVNDDSRGIIMMPQFCGALMIVIDDTS